MLPPELRPLPLPPDADAAGVEVWTVELAVEPLREGNLAGHLDPAERARAARFKFERDRRRYVVARGLLRELLGGRLGKSPASVGFRVGPHGKPALLAAAAAEETTVRFNVSHSGDRALLALADGGREVGVDLESAARLGDARDLPALAARTLSPADLARWGYLPEDGRRQVFLRAWTRLEAYAKATGDGLGNVLGKTSVLRPAGVGDWDRWRPDDAAAGGWRGWDLNVGAGWAGALVVGSLPG